MYIHVHTYMLEGFVFTLSRSVCVSVSECVCVHILLQVKSEFLDMLSEDHALSESSQWKKVKGRFERDPRYRAVLRGSGQREEWFREYVKALGSRVREVRSNRRGRWIEGGREREW